MEDFWLRVADVIHERYGDREDLQVYIHGDGAPWIKNSRFVLDKYHFLKYLNPVVGGHENYRQYILDELDGGSRLKIDHLMEAIVERDLCSREAGEKFVSYMHRNWDGIQIWYDQNHQAGPSCADGLVSVTLPEVQAKQLQKYKLLCHDTSADSIIIPWGKRFIEDGIQQGADLADVPVINVHGLRHSHASLLISQGVNIVLISKRLGHKNVSETLDTYSHFFPDDEAEMIATLNKLVPE